MMSFVLNEIFTRYPEERKKSNLARQFAKERKLRKQMEIDQNRIMDDAMDNQSSNDDMSVNNEGLHQSYSNPYRRAPSFALYLWAVVPILFIALGDVKVIVLAVVATLINFFLIQIYTRPVNRYLLVAIVNVIAFLLFWAIKP